MSTYVFRLQESLSSVTLTLYIVYSHFIGVVVVDVVLVCPGLRMVRLDAAR